jgi:2-polyprenyl-3-methyl-5-hydroxy-6-metoxy-1,4-benzoquinol methylase
MEQMTMKKPTIEEYWRDLAQPWEDASYEGDTSKLTFIERIATYGRQHIHRRKESAIEIIKPFVKGKVIVDIGCAGGIFEMDLLRYGALDVTGVDVSADAVRTASQRAKAMGLDQQAHFYNCSIDQFDKYVKGKVDILTGLGILEYLRPELIRDLVNHVKPKGILFSFDEKEYTLKKGVHYVYRVVKQMPYYKKFRQDEIAKLLAACGYSQVQFKREHQNSFVYYLPAALANR